MNIFKFLTARTGAVNKVGLAGVVLAGGLAVYNLTGYFADTPKAQDEAVRSLAQIMSSGGQMPAEYSGINISRGGVEFASAEEISAQNASMFDGGESAINAMNSALDGFSARRSDLSAGEDGLGMGANAALLRDGQAASVGGVSVPGEKGMKEGLHQANKEAVKNNPASGGSVLQRASLAKMGGSNLGAGGNGGFGAPSGRSAASSAVSAERSSRAGNLAGFSGAMPDGSTLVASNSTLHGATSSSTSFRRVNPQDYVGQGRSSREGQDLRSIAVRSAKTAANASRAANEADQAFMSGERLAGGVQVFGENMETMGTGASADFVDEMDTNIGNFDASIEDIDTTEQEKKALRSKLARDVVGLLFTVASAMITISLLKDKWPWGGILALSISGAAMWKIGTFIKDAITYISKYDGWTIGVIFTTLGAAFAAGIVLAWASTAVSDYIKELMGKIFSSLGGGSNTPTPTTNTPATPGLPPSVNPAVPGIPHNLPGSRLPPMM